MINNLFVNLPVKDLEKSKAFFSQMGLSFNAQFTDENAACLVLGPNFYAMLLVEKFYSTFTKKQIANTATTSEVINALMVEKRSEVDDLADKAFKAGASKYRDPEDMGFMYTRSFQDLDGHLWEIGWMDPAHIKKE
jgi:uncharacterized protein